MENIFDNLIKIRRDLHKIPELSFKEEKTSGYIEDFLKIRNIGYKKVLDIGIVAFIEGRDKNFTIGFRADMDALPIEEELDVSYKSQHKGIMHACGHDFHMSIVLNLIDYFNKNIPPVSLLFIFQPGEEGAGGALKMIKNGIFSIFNKPDVIFGYHINPEIETGIIAARGGSAWAGSVEFEINFSGTGGHGAYPHKAADLVYGFSSFYTFIQSYISRTINPEHSILLTCGRLEGAKKSNVLSNNIIAGCTFRYYEDEDKQKMISGIKQSLKSIEKLLNCKIKMKIISDYIPLKNDIKLLKNIKKAYSTNIESNEKKRFPELKTAEKVTISDDMGYFLKEVNGVYFFLGVKRDDTTGLHTSTLNPDESGLLYGFNFFKWLVLNYKEYII